MKITSYLKINEIKPIPVNDPNYQIVGPQNYFTLLFHLVFLKPPCDFEIAG